MDGVYKPYMRKSSGDYKKFTAPFNQSYTLCLMDDWRLRAARLRDRQGLSNVDIARRMGCTPAAVGHWLKGRREPTLDDIERLASILGVGSAELLFGISTELSTEDRETVADFVRLDPTNKSLVKALIRQLGTLKK